MRLDEVFGGLRETLARDDFLLEVKQIGVNYVFDISAGPTACAECLVPEAIFIAIASRVGAEAGLDIDRDRVTVNYH
jgi:hypothetical protein